MKVGIPSGTMEMETSLQLMTVTNLSRQIFQNLGNQFVVIVKVSI
jgi:hypothetical protein